MSLPTKKRKLVSETDPERCSSVAKKRRICKEDMTENDPSSKPLLKGKRGKAKKSKLVDKNVSQSLAPASEGQLSQTVIHPENKTHDVPGAAKVWIIGSEHYITGAKQSTKECYGENFELNVTVSWIGKAKLRWRDVLSLFYMEMSRQRSAPDVLVLHAGTNDMGNTDVSELVNTMLKDLTHLHGAYPNMKIVYSWITPRSKWGKFKVDQINEDRKTVNKTIEQNAGLFNGVVIKHERLKPSAGFLFQENGIHFSNEGFEMFVCSIHDTIEQILNQASSGEQSQPQSNDGTTSAPHKVQTTMPEKDKPSREHLNEMSPTVSPPAKKRKLESETDSERCSSVAKRRICGEGFVLFRTENDPSSEASPSLPEDQHRPNNQKPFLKWRTGKAKKRKLVYENVSQSLGPASEGQLDSESPLARPTVIHSEKTQEVTSGSTEVCSSSTTQSHDVPGAANDDGVNLSTEGNPVILNNTQASIEERLQDEQWRTSFLDDFSDRDFLIWMDQMIA